MIEQLEPWKFNVIKLNKKSQTFRFQVKNYTALNKSAKEIVLCLYLYTSLSARYSKYSSIMASAGSCPLMSPFFLNNENCVSWYNSNIKLSAFWTIQVIVVKATHLSSGLHSTSRISSVTECWWLVRVQILVSDSNHLMTASLGR